MFENLEMFIESVRACFFYDEKTLVFFSVTDWMNFWLLPFFIDEELAKLLFSDNSQEHLPNRYSFDTYFSNSSIVELFGYEDTWIGYYVFGWLEETLDWILVFSFLSVCIWLIFNLLSRIGSFSIILLFIYSIFSFLILILFGYFFNPLTIASPFLFLSETFNYVLINFVWVFSLPFTFFFGFLVSVIGILDYSFVYKFPLYSPLDITDYPTSIYVNMVGSPQIFGILRLHENLLSIISGISIFVLFLLALCLIEYGFFSFNGFKTNSFFLSELLRSSVIISSDHFSNCISPKKLNNLNFLFSSNPYLFKLNDDIHVFTTGSYYDRSILNLPFLVKINDFLEKSVFDFFELLRNVSIKCDFTKSVSENITLSTTTLIDDNSVKWSFFEFNSIIDRIFKFSGVFFEIFGCYVLFFKDLVNFSILVLNRFNNFVIFFFVYFS